MLSREVRALSDAEIREQIEEHKEEFLNLRFQIAIGQLEDYTRLREVKKIIARLRTIQRERELAAELLREESNG